MFNRAASCFEIRAAPSRPSFLKIAFTNPFWRGMPFSSARRTEVSTAAWSGTSMKNICVTPRRKILSTTSVFIASGRSCAKAIKSSICPSLRIVVVSNMRVKARSRTGRAANSSELSSAISSAVRLLITRLRRCRAHMRAARSLPDVASSPLFSLFSVKFI